MKVLRFLLGLIIVLLWLYHIYGTVIDSSAQWDFPTFYYAAVAQAQGENPYDTQVLSTRSAGRARFPYLYPIAAVYVFRPLSAMPYGVARIVWLALKLCALGLLMLVWRRVFLARADPLLFHGIALLGFGGTLVWDIKAGNVAIFEQVLLWVGFWQYSKGRNWQFAASIVLASLFKLTPITFLALLFMQGGSIRGRLSLLVAALTCFSVLVIGPYAQHPKLLPDFVTKVVATRESGPTTPCFLAMCDEVCDKLPVANRMKRGIATATYFGFAVAVLVGSRRRLLTVSKSCDRVGALTAAVIMYALLVPRLKCYSYGLLVVPAVLCVESLGSLTSGAVFAALLTIFPTWYNVSFPRIMTRNFHEYYPYLQIVGMYLWWLGSSDTKQTCISDDHNRIL